MFPMYGSVHVSLPFLSFVSTLDDHIETMIVCCMCVQLSEEAWVKPNEFNPERFMKTNAADEVSNTMWLCCCVLTYSWP